MHAGSVWLRLLAADHEERGTAEGVSESLRDFFNHGSTRMNTGGMKVVNCREKAPRVVTTKAGRAGDG